MSWLTCIGRHSAILKGETGEGNDPVSTGEGAQRRLVERMRLEEKGVVVSGGDGGIRGYEHEPVPGVGVSIVPGARFGRLRAAWSSVPQSRGERF